jgi:GNAT superfamily N-acetyltransferase
MIDLRPMTPNDLGLGLSLSAQSGWNQTEADWRRCLALQPDGCFVARLDGVSAGTATTCLFGPIAWVAMVLVDQRFRRQGVARALMKHVLDFLDRQGVATVRLDATPLGQPLYEQLGFAGQFTLDRYEGIATSSEPSDVPLLTVPPERWPELLALDEAVTRTVRRKLLLQLFSEQPAEVRAIEKAGRVSGFLTVRAGTRALQVGPCIGDFGPWLLADACRRHAGRRVYLDVPSGNQPVRDLTGRLGLTVQRSFLRMCRGAPVVEDRDRLWASSGPENG